MRLNAERSAVRVARCMRHALALSGHTGQLIVHMQTVTVYRPICDTGVYSDTAVVLTEDGRQVSRWYFVDERDYTWRTQCNNRGIKSSIHNGIN